MNYIKDFKGFLNENEAETVDAKGLESKFNAKVFPSGNDGTLRVEVSLIKPAIDAPRQKVGFTYVVNTVEPNSTMILKSDYDKVANSQEEWKKTGTFTPMLNKYQTDDATKQMISIFDSGQYPYIFRVFIRDNFKTLTSNRSITIDCASATLPQGIACNSKDNKIILYAGGRVEGTTAPTKFRIEKGNIIFEPAK